MNMCSNGIHFSSKDSRRVSGEIRVSNSRCDHVGGGLFFSLFEEVSTIEYSIIL